MHVIVLILWIIAGVLFAIAALMPRPFNIVAAGLFFFNLWLGLTFLLEVTDPITL